MSDRPLRGVRTAVTRARSQAEELAAPLRSAGAEVLVAPLIRIAPSIDSDSVQEAVRQLSQFEWLVFTSANGVELFTEAIHRAGAGVEQLSQLRIACVGPATAAAAARKGIKTEVIPDEFVGAALAGALTARIGTVGARVLIARAGGAREQLPRLLRQHGALVSEIELYRSVMDEEGARMLRDSISADMLDVLTFTSGSTVRYFAEAVGQPGRAIVAVIGPVTAQVAQEHDMTVSIQAEPHTISGLVESIMDHFRRLGRPTEE